MLHELDSLFLDCKSWYESGIRADGVYRISPDGEKEFDAYCDMTNGGWTIIQRRMDNSVDFYRGWADYRAGFGNMNGILL